MAEISDAELAELRKKAHAHDSEQGRLQKTQAELDAERTARLALERRLESQPPASQIDGRAVEVFGQEGVTVLQSMFGKVSEKLDALTTMQEARNNAETQAHALRKFQGDLGSKLADNNLPGFASRIYGGDLSEAWARFVEARPSVRRAQVEGDIEAVADVVSIFIHQNKEQVAGSGYSPQSVPGYSPAVKCDYSDADYQRDINALQRQKDNVAITEEQFKTQADGLYDRWVAAQEKMEKAATAYGLV